LATSTSWRGSIINKTGANDLEYDLRYDSAGDRFQLRVSTGAAFANLTTINANNFGSPSLATWYLLHAWHDAAANTINISVNAGTADSTAFSAAGGYDSGASFKIGATPDFSEYFDGLIDDALLMKNAFLDATERTEDYNAGTGVAFSDWAAPAPNIPWPPLVQPYLMRHKVASY
jgi:hypothetical protein